jgi:hypothetical protein
MWLTRPKPSRRHGGPAGQFIFAFLIIAGIFAAAAQGNKWIIRVALGLACCAAAFFFAFLYALGPGRPIYAVTDRRAVLLTFGWGGDFNYWYAEDLGRMHTRPGPDGSGDVIFGNEFNTYSTYAGRRHEEVQEAERAYDGAWYGVPDLAEAEVYLSALKAHEAGPRAQ